MTYSTVFNPALDKESKFNLYAQFSPWPLCCHYQQECQLGLQLLDLDTCPLDSDWDLQFISHRPLNSSESVMTFVHYKSALNLNR